MIQAEQMLDQFKTIPIITVAGAIYLSLFESEEWQEFTDSKRNLLYIWVTFHDRSGLKMHRDGWMKAYDSSAEIIEKIKRVHAQGTNRMSTYVLILVFMNQFGISTVSMDYQSKPLCVSEGRRVAAELPDSRFYCVERK